MRPNALLAASILLAADLLPSQAGTPQVTAMVPPYPPAASVKLNPESLMLELDRAILILQRGLEENWGTRDQYLTAFENTPGPDTPNADSPSSDSIVGPLTDAKNYVKCEIGANIRIHQPWDEGVPIEVEVQRAITELTERRSDAEQAKTAAAKTTNAESPNPEAQAAWFQLPFCVVPVPKKISISAGVAATQLKTRVDPIYPAEALQKHISGTVVLLATISTEGLVEAVRVISGPALLQQPALDAVRQWTYRPYLLNRTPIEVETTVNVAFVANRGP